MTSNYVLPVELHNKLIADAYQLRGYSQEEATIAAEVCSWAAWHGIHSHNALKALDLDTKFGSVVGGCNPRAKVEVLASKFKAVEKWNANLKLGQVVAKQAIDRCCELADIYGTGTVVVDNAFHYLWGGGYVIDAAQRGYIAYTNCTATLAEVVPFGGTFPTLGTNPHSWAFPTTKELGFPICVDWATSTMAFGKVQSFLREGKKLPDNTGIDRQGKITCEPSEIYALLPFGGHKGYGLSLIDELYAAYTGGYLPTVRGHFKDQKDTKCSSCFYFQVTHPESINCESFFNSANQAENVKKVVEDILSHGNEQCLLPGQPEHQAAEMSKKLGGIICTAAELERYQEIAQTTKNQLPELKQVA